MRMMWRIAAISAVVSLALAGGRARGAILYKDYLVNPSFEEGEEGKEPYGWSSESIPGNDKTSFVKAKGGRPKEVKEGEKADECEAHLTVKGDDKQAVGSQIIGVKVAEPTQFTFSAWIRSDGAFPAGDNKPYISVEALKLDEAAGRWVTPEGGGRKSTEIVPTADWTKVTVTKVFPADTQRVKLVIGSYTRDLVIAVDDCAFAQGLYVPEFNVEKEGKQLEELRGSASEQGAEFAALEKRFEEIKALLVVAGNKETAEAKRREAADKLAGLIKDYFTAKDALKKSLLESLVQ
ncbi:MAG: hypothetical protein V2A58_07010 [Planctomycetota bacterium]